MSRCGEVFRSGNQCNVHESSVLGDRFKGADAFVVVVVSCQMCLGHGFMLVKRLLATPTVRAAALAFVLGIIPQVKALFVGGPFPPLGEGARVMGWW
jgi:hypothetical protein